MNKRQKEIFEFIKAFLTEHKYSPTVREIGEDVGLKSSSTVHGHLDKMREKGFINFTNSRSRTLQILR
ncbi:hypothetical protein ACFVR1_03440 [Psychrobacillus sp. NPDC058041]|uniref:LexA family protein n=1 Tax=Psychrobacillus sp. NPDC058041 TaxID=3346310 RepID=UPI0036DB4073